jgi:hypothetical protein
MGGSGDENPQEVVEYVGIEGRIVGREREIE